MNYEQPYWVLVTFDGDDIICSSPNVTITPGGDGEDLDIGL